MSETEPADRSALMHRLTYHAAGLSDEALQLLVAMAEVDDNWYNCYMVAMAQFNMLLKARDRHNLRRIVELTGVSKAEAVRRALEQHRRTVEKEMVKEAERAMAAQALAGEGGA